MICNVTFYNHKPVQYQFIYLYKDHQGRVLGGANNTINYFTQLSKEEGLSTEIVGKNVKAGFFVQLYRNMYRSWKKTFLIWKNVYSSSETTTQGRKMLNTT